VKDGVQLEAYTYDNAGRLTQRIHATEGTSTYAYDARGLLTQVTKPGTTISYTYDALGARKSKTVNGTTTKYLTAPVFGMSRVVAELNDNLSLKATYVYGGQQLLKEEPTASNRDHDVYLLSDGIVGSITHVTDSSGQVKDEYDYDAFGIRSTTSQTSNSHGHYGYTGQEYDAEAGLLYLRARYYDPQIGRFISADPFWGRLEEPASQNRYAYVHNNPLLYTDPLGLDTEGYSFNLTIAAFGHSVSFGYAMVTDDSGTSAMYLTGAAGKAAGWGISFVDSRESTTASTVFDLQGVGHRSTIGIGTPIDLGGEAAFIAGQGYTGDARGVGLVFGSPVLATSEGTYSVKIWDNFRPPLSSGIPLVVEPAGVCPAP
jgi:RHS repeat-associated protein